LLDVTDVFRICSERRREGRRVIDAHIGEPSHPPPVRISEILRGIGDVGSKYMPFEGLRETRERISKFARDFLGRDIDPDGVFVTNGGAQALTSTLMVLRGRKVLLPAPGFTQYFDNARVMGLRFATYNSAAEDLVDEILGKLGDAAAVLINYPNNPTGFVPERDALMELWDELRRRNVLLINDAAYSQIYFDSRPEVPGDVIIDTFSKTFGVPGLRLGYVYWGPEDRKKIFDAVYITSAGVSEISQIVLNSLLDSLTEDYLEKVRSHYKRKRDKIIELMGDFSFPYPRGAFYIFASHKKLRDSRELALRLLQRDPAVGIVPGDVFMGDEGSFRICYSLLSDDEAEEMVGIILEEIHKM